MRIEIIKNNTILILFIDYNSILYKIDIRQIDTT